MSETALKITQVDDQNALLVCDACLTRYTGHHDCGPSEVDEADEHHGCNNCGGTQFTGRRTSEDTTTATIDGDNDLVVDGWEVNWTDEPEFSCDSCGEEWEGHVY